MYGPFIFCGANRIPIGGVKGGGCIACLINGMYGPAGAAPIIPGGGIPKIFCVVGSSILRILPERRQNGEFLTLKKNMKGWSTIKLGVSLSKSMGFAGTIFPCALNLMIDL